MAGLAMRCLALACLLLAACDESEQVNKPAPEVLTRDAIGHYCQMIVADHPGPKAQIFLTDREAPVWFSSVRDAIAYTLLPEEPKNLAAVYVTDMAKATWDAPEPDTWIDAEAAHFVIESDRRGGMGALEAVPFSDAADAEHFIARHGGRIVPYGEIPSAYILSADAGPAATHDHDTPGHDMPDHDTPSHDTLGHDTHDQGAMGHQTHEEQSEVQHDSTH